MRILALEPYYGGSHRAFLDGWVAHSRHHWTLLTLPPHHWKWRMRHSGATLAREVGERVADSDGGETWDVLFATSMLPLADFRALAPAAVSRLPTVLYFHENQLTYPVPPGREDARDVHFAFTNLVSALAATELWFNSAFHRDAFLDALPRLLAKMPDGGLADAPDRVRARSHVHPPGIQPPAPRSGERAPGPLRLLWAARWEHDKNPEGFFDALYALAARGIDFRVDVLGESFRKVPATFAVAKERLAGKIGRWGFQESREAYHAALREADVFVSTAHHEFFGLSAAEAMAAGGYPLLPERLAYPELLGEVPGAARSAFLYPDGALVDRLAGLAGRLEQGALWPGGDAGICRRGMERYGWPGLAERLDGGLIAAAS